MTRLREALAHLDNGWCKGEFVKRQKNSVQFCSVGALQEAYGYNDLTHVVDLESFQDDVKAVADVIRANYSEYEHHTPVNDGAVVVYFNDYLAESFDEVRAVFEKAAVAQEEKG